EGIGLGGVDADGGNMQKGAGVAAVGHQQRRALGVVVHALGKGLGAAVGGAVNHVLEVRWQRAKLAVAEIPHHGAHPLVLPELLLPRLAVAGIAPQLVVGGQGRGDGTAEIAGQAGDEHFLAVYHCSSPVGCWLSRRYPAGPATRSCQVSRRRVRSRCRSFPSTPTSGPGTAPARSALFTTAKRGTMAAPTSVPGGSPCQRMNSQPRWRPALSTQLATPGSVGASTKLRVPSGLARAWVRL